MNGEHYPSRRGKPKLDEWLLMKTLKQFLPTIQGWVFRKTVQYMGTTAAAATGWLVGNGVSDDNAAAIWTGATAVALSLLEIGFSRIAAKLKEYPN